MTTARTIGYHENTPKITSMGREEQVREPPPRTQVSGRSLGAAQVRVDRPIAAPLLVRWFGRWRAGGEPCGSPPGDCVEITSLPDQPLGHTVGLCSRAVDVRVLVRQHRLHDRVERRIDALRRCSGFRQQGCVNMWSVNGVICVSGTLMYGWIQVLARSYCAWLKIGSAGTPTG